MRAAWRNGKLPTLAGLLALLSLLCSPAHAACTNPAAGLGAVVYNADQNAPQVCTGNGWIALGTLNPSAGGGSCSNPAAIEGTIVYNNDYDVLQYCDGTNWIAVQAAVTGSGGAPLESTVAQVAVGQEHACLRKTNNTVWCWGTNGEGQLGQGDQVNRAVPTQVGAATDWTSLCASEDFNCGVRSNGTLWCWGKDTDGNLGNGATTGRQTSPVQEATSATNWGSVSCGGGFGDDGFACAVKTDGTLHCWGGDDQSQQGQGTTNVPLDTPTQIGSATDWAQVSVGSDHACARKTGGTVYCWGDGGNGNIGDGATSDRGVPTQESSAATNWASVEAGFDVTCAIKTNGTLYCWGSGADGGHGLGNTSNQPNPTQVGTDTNWSQVSLSSPTTNLVAPATDFQSSGCSTKTNGTLWCWGENDNGQIGDGTQGTNRLSPVQVGTNTDWTAVNIAGPRSCGLRGSTLYCWGYDPHPVTIYPERVSGSF